MPEDGVADPRTSGSARPLVIANPVAGRGRGRQLLQAAAGDVVGGLGPHRLVWTTRRGDAVRIAREEAPRRRLIIAYGGDGTLSEVARGLWQGGAGAELGMLPCGTGNDFAKDGGMTGPLPEAVRALLGAPALPTDLGLVETRDPDGEAIQPTFVNSLSLGLAARVADRAARGGRRLGQATYAAALLKELAVFRARPFRVALDGDVRRPRLVLNFTILNSRRFGGGIRLTPDADPGDGKLDAVLIGPLRPIALADTLRRLAIGAHFERPEVEHRRIRKASLRPLAGARAGDVLEADGDPIRFRGELRISVIPGAIRVRRIAP